MISSAIHNLENALGGVKLFEKAGRNIRLTDEGRYYQENVDEAIHLLHQASMTLRDSRTQAPIVIRMGVVSGTVDGFLAREIVNMRMFLLYGNPRRHIFVLARVIVIVNSGLQKADGVKLV